MSTLKDHGLASTIDKKGIVSDGIIFEKYIWQLQGDIIASLSEKTLTIKDGKEDFRFFTKCLDGNITMWGMNEDDKISEYFELIEYYENLEEPENAIGIPMEYKGEKDWDIDGWINRQL